MSTQNDHIGVNPVAERTNGICCFAIEYMELSIARRESSVSEESVARASVRPDVNDMQRCAGGHGKFMRSSQYVYRALITGNRGEHDVEMKQSHLRDDIRNRR
jgi:hypothetical protein